MGLLSVPEGAGSGAKGWGKADGAEGEEAGLDRQCFDIPTLMGF